MAREITLRTALNSAISSLKVYGSGKIDEASRKRLEKLRDDLDKIEANRAKEVPSCVA